MSDINSPLQPDNYYHIYNRGINGENIFIEEKNYNYFLQKYSKYLSPVLDTYVYCLLKNHFHLLVKVKCERELQLFYEKSFNNKINGGLHSAEFIVNKQFARLFSCYTQSINKSIGRTGALMESPFKRVQVDNDNYFTQLVWYIHHNPEKHQFVSDFRDYPHSSYHSHLLQKATKLKRNEVLNWFGNRSEFKKFHQEQHSLRNMQELIIE